MKKEMYLAFVIFFPFLAGIPVYGAGVYCRKKKEKAGAEGRWESLGDFLAVCVAAAEFAVMLGLALPVLRTGGGEALSLEIPEICGMGLYFILDGFRAMYGCVAAFMWMMAAAFSVEYFTHHASRSRYYLFLLWTLGATVGVFLSGDLYTTFIFFEIMSFTSYVWVAQEENGPALRAAGTYLAVAILGGLVLLMGIFLLYHCLGTLVTGELSGAAAGYEDKATLYIAGACMLFGFGAKAGAFPLHIWLPKAHPVAPAPASALLSGILTKTGVYGILIVSCNLFLPDRAWGFAILLTGLVTMLGGAILAVFSVDLKRTLACSSMSQIGFILTGIGMLCLPGEEDGMIRTVSAAHQLAASQGSFLHMVNHSLIKLVLFLAAGVVYMNAHALNLNDIRGFGRKKPLLAGSFLTGALAIGGIPLFGGYISKTLLHESIVEYGGDGFMKAAEMIFLFSGGLTVAYMTKIFVVVFVEKNQDAARQEAYDRMRGYMKPVTVFALAGSAGLLFFWGLFPDSIMMSAGRSAQEFLRVEGETHSVSWFGWENLKGGLTSIGIGAAVYFLFIRTCLMKRKENGEREYINVWPQWLDLEELIYRPVLLGILPVILGVLCRILDSFADMTVVILRKTLYRDSRLPHERPEGNVFTEVLGKLLNGFQSLGNRTWRRTRPVHRDYVHLAAVKSEEFRETNHIIQRSLSFGLLLFCIGLALTLLYIIG